MGQIYCGNCHSILGKQQQWESLSKQCIKKYAVRQQPQGATVIAPANRSTNGIDYSPMILTMIVLGFLWIGSFSHLVVCADAVITLFLRSSERSFEEVCAA